MWEEEDVLLGEDETFKGSTGRVSPSVPTLLIDVATASPLSLGVLPPTGLYGKLVTRCPSMAAGTLLLVTLSPVKADITAACISVTLQLGYNNTAAGGV